MEVTGYRPAAFFDSANSAHWQDTGQFITFNHFIPNFDSVVTLVFSITSQQTPNMDIV